MKIPPYLITAWPWLVLISGILPLFTIIRPRYRVATGVWVLVALLGWLAGGWESHLRKERRSAVAGDPTLPAVPNIWRLRGLVRMTGWASEGSQGFWRGPAILVRGVLDQGPEQGSGAPCNGDRLLLSGKGHPPGPGEMLAVALRVSVPKGGDLPGIFDQRKYLAGRGILWKASIQERGPPQKGGPLEKIFRTLLGPLRGNILFRLQQLMPGPEASLAGAVLLGAKGRNSRSASKPFASLGLAHLFAVSGLHVGVLLGLLLLPGKLWGQSPRTGLLLLLSVLPAYALLTGLPGSVVRAAGLALLASAAHPLGRRMAPLHALGLLFWLGCLFQPWQVLDLGVKLSYGAAGGIISCSPLLSKLPRPRGRFWEFLLGGLAVSMIAQWSTLPLVASSFGRLSLLSPVANLVAVPLFGFGVWLIVTALTLSLVSWPLAKFVSAWAWLFFRSLTGAVNGAGPQATRWALGLPSPGVGVVLLWVVVSSLGFWALRRAASRKTSGTKLLLVLALGGCLVLSALVGPKSWLKKQTGPEVWQFDVGQGDCSVVRFPDGWVGMVDTAGRFGFDGRSTEGPLSRKILPWLKRFGMDNMNLVMLTHGHLDHVGGVPTLLRESQVRNWLVSGKAGTSLGRDSTNVRVMRAQAGQILHRWRHWRLKVFYPGGPVPSTFHENDHSLVVALQHHGNNQYLWSGDLENGGEALLLAGQGTGGATRVWKAGHHGSNTSGSPAFLKAIDPELIIISCGVGNGYHHPSHGWYVVEGDTIPTLRTDLEGSVHLRWEKGGDLRWSDRVRQGRLGPGLTP